MCKVLILFVITVSAVCHSGCKFDEIKSVSTTGKLSIVVDENVETMIKDEITEFERFNPDAKVSMNSAPSSNAIVDLINGDTKLIIVARNLTEEERSLIQKNKLEVKEYPFAIDGIGFIVNVKNPIKRVTSDDLKNIFSGNYKYWTDIKAQNEEQNSESKKYFKGPLDNIKVFYQRKNSATNKYIQDSILRDLEYSVSATVCSTSVQMLSAIKDNENAIGIISMNWLSLGTHDTIDTTVSTLKVSKIRASGVQEDFADFHQGLLYNGKYPYRRTIYALTTDSDIQLSTGFITFLLSTDGQKIVLKNSLVPVSQPVRTIQLN